MADTVTTAGVIVGLLLVKLTGFVILDPLAACLVASIITLNGPPAERAADGSLRPGTDSRIASRSPPPRAGTSGSMFTCCGPGVRAISSISTSI
ncbi:MAG: hypothetical protein Q9Q13_02000 [Acidobacteriota bacterium]|nr:hypothetical protein [Acidobacteriota bacterium]